MPHLRPKIEAVVRRGNAVPDSDCPTSMEDMSYWVTVSRSRTETETLEKTAEVSGEVKGQDALSVILNSDLRAEQLTGVPSASSGSAPPTDALLKFVRESGAGPSLTVAHVMFLSCHT